MDSTKVEIINHSFDKLVNEIERNSNNKHSIWDVLIPLLIGSALTLFTQFLIELFKNKKETEKTKQLLISKGRSKTYLIAQILKDLSMYKSHKQYYARACDIAITDAEKEDCFKKHYEKGQEQRETETKLDENIAEYFQIVTEYIIISKYKDHFQEEFNKIFEYEHPKTSKFTDCHTSNELIAGLEKEEKKLNAEYKPFYNLFDTIQSSMK